MPSQLLLRLALSLAFLLALAPSSPAEPCSLIPTFADGKKPLREIFISPAGDNFKGTGTRAQPFQTLAHVVGQARPGDAIRLLSGVYPPNTFLADITGTLEAPIWIGGEPGAERPVISGGSLAFQFSRIRYVVIENLEITGASGNGINCDDGGEVANSNATRHVIFRNLLIRDIGRGGNQDGLKLSGVNDFFVLDCEFAAISANGSGIDHVGCHQGLIARSIFRDCGNAIQCKGGSEDIEIRANKFVNVAGRVINIGGSTGFQFFRPPLSTNTPNFESKNIRVLANIFHKSEAPVAYVGTVNSLVAHNTIVEPKRWIVRILQETVSKEPYTFLPSGKNRFINNLVYYNTSEAGLPINIGSNTDAPSFEFANNLWYAADRPDRSRPPLPAQESAGLSGVDPRLHNVAGGDFRLQENSPALGKGMVIPECRSDFNGNCLLNPPTIGAIEKTSFRFAPLNEKSLGLWEGNLPVLVYNHGSITNPAVPTAKARSSYLHPIYGLDGEVITGDFEKDHDYHRGLYWAWPHIKVGEQDEVDLWSLRGIEQKFVRFASLHTNAPFAGLAVENEWLMGGKKIMREEASFMVHPADQQGRIIDVELAWTPVSQPITLSGAPGKSYGGFTFRFGPRSTTIITVPNGRAPQDLVMTKLPWADFSADFAGAPQFSGATIFVHPRHPDFPPTWMTRHYGLLAVGWPGVEPKTFPPGESFRVRHRLWIHRGAPTKTDLAKKYEEYTTSLKP